MMARRLVVLIAGVLLTISLWRGLGGPRRATTTVGRWRYVPSSEDWSKMSLFYPVGDMARPPSTAQLRRRLPRVQARTSGEADHGHGAVWRVRKEAVKRAFVKSWQAYKTHAWTKDELMPLSGRGRQTLSGWAAQLVDALDCLYIMGLDHDFAMAVSEVAVIDWARPHDATAINLFEVTIRYLGGLLAAYDLSHEPVLRAKAVELGNLVYAAFDTPNRLPSFWFDLARARNGDQEADQSMPSAAVGSLALEFTRLSQITGDAKYYDATERVKRFLRNTQSTTKLPGLWPRRLNLRDETADGEAFTLGAETDSLYEYLPKMHALLGGLDDDYSNMTVRALDAVRKHLLFQPLASLQDDGILLSGSVAWSSDETELTPQMQHLACFAGGTFALAGKLLQRRDYVDVGSRLAAGCVWAYDSFPSNLMPEVSELVACTARHLQSHATCQWDQSGMAPARLASGQTELPDGFVRVIDGRYLLRPEAIESVFYMWRITGDQVWREAAWRMWEAVVRETETETAFAAVSDVTMRSSDKLDSMETFWLSETVKYYYLIFDDESVINLDEWVLNTEAHPLRRPKPARA
ncbi:hypothetical protein CDD82_4644 [Ophiocordyceps australis]|uniref:alpha-1,2-Mannosidase n=1 Tax=Ophiocordyceps australis TaxID=1399860 RepID=A0A2C5Z1V1_9HYPO|nr:hypothetical protein CDD82_4644 [Ophiocordyceps australis]